MPQGRICLNFANWKLCFSVLCNFYAEELWAHLEGGFPRSSVSCVFVLCLYVEGENQKKKKTEKKPLCLHQSHLWKGSGGGGAIIAFICEPTPWSWSHYLRLGWIINQNPNETGEVLFFVGKHQREERWEREIRVWSEVKNLSKQVSWPDKLNDKLKRRYGDNHTCWPLKILS